MMRTGLSYWLRTIGINRDAPEISDVTQEEFDIVREVAGEKLNFMYIGRDGPLCSAYLISFDDKTLFFRNADNNVRVRTLDDVKFGSRIYWNALHDYRNMMEREILSYLRAHGTNSSSDVLKERYQEALEGMKQILKVT